MFLDWISTLGFMTHNAESGILLSFPITTRSMIAAQLADFLLKDNTPITTLSTAAHLGLIFECCGQGLGLPIVDHKGSNILRSVTELYRRWLLEQTRPPAVEQDEQGTYKKIFSHFSLVFAPRMEKESSLDIQVELCTTVLEILLTAGRIIGGRFQVDTWEHLLKVLLGVGDSLLKGTRGSVDEVNSTMPSLGTKLCPLFLKVLFELWLRSGTKNQQLWDSFKELLQGWRYRRPVIDQWSNTVLGLTNRVIRILYGPEEGTESVVIHNTSYDFTKRSILIAYRFNIDDKLALGEEFTTHAWHRILHILGDFETLNNASNYTAAIQGIRQVMNALIAVGTGSKSLTSSGNWTKNAPKSPDGNTILHVIGQPLFRALNMKKRDFTFDKGIAEAIQALCHLFVAKHKTDFVSVYLATFYRGLEECLARNVYLMDIVLTNCDTLLQFELKGSRTLVPAFLHAVTTVLTSGKGKKPLAGIASQPAALRASCIKILGYIVGLPCSFHDVKFPDAKGKEGWVAAYSDIPLVLEETLLLEALKTEDNPKNLHSLMWVITTYIYENITAVSNFPNNYVSLLLSHIMSQDSWPIEVTLTALQVLSELSNIYPLFRRDKGREAGVTIVKSLCTVIAQEQSIVSGSKNAVPEDLISSCFYTMNDWLMKEQWALKEEELLKKVFETIDIGLGFIKSVQQTTKDGAPVTVDFHAPTPKIQESAEYTLINVLNLIDNFPRNFVHLSSLSCLQSEDDVVSAALLKPGDVSWYCFDRTTIIAVIRHYDKLGDAPTSTVVVRDPSGRYVWTSKLQCAPYVKHVERTYTGRTTNVFENPLLSSTASTGKLSEENERFFFYLMGLLEPAEKRRHDSILEKAKEREDSEKQFLKDKNYGLNVDIQAKPPELPPNDGSSTSVSSSRLLLTNLGFNSLNNRSRFYSLHSLDNLQPMELIQKLKILDQARERDAYQIGVVYVPARASREEDMFEGSGSGSADFKDFVNSIGFPTKLEDHFGYRGGLDVSAEMLPYYATYEYEALFHVTSLIASTAQKRRVISSDKVVISWVEDLDSPLIRSHKLECTVNILIQPLKSGLYRIRIHKAKTNVPAFGPLQDEVCVSKHILSTVVRATAINAARSLREEKTKPFMTRKAIIEEIINAFKVQAPVNQYYASQLIMTPQ